MLIPLAVLAFGALFAGIAISQHFIGDQIRLSFGTARSPKQPALTIASCTTCAMYVPVWVNLAPTW